ncbi:MAG: hypothetical protein QM503_06640 [Bacteroidota bacterium]
MIKKALAIMTPILIVTAFWDRVKQFTNLARFGKDADFSLKRHYEYIIEGGINGELTFLLDIDVINKSNSEVLANNLLVTAYNEEGEYVGQSVPFDTPLLIKPYSVTPITGIKVRTQLKKVLFDYAVPMLLQIIQNSSFENTSIGRTITLDMIIELNGVKINKQQTLTI